MYGELAELIRRSDKIVFFGGAGVSTESGIPDFRGSGGLYTEDDGEISPEEILETSYFDRHPEEFYRFYREKMLYPSAEPNSAHLFLSRLEEEGKDITVITQNIDGLHQAAGSKNVIELHGSTLRNFCTACGKRFGLEAVTESTGIPLCSCGGIIKPDVVLYGESLKTRDLMDAEEAIAEADLLIVGGTSLTVQPACSLVADYCGEELVIINKTPTLFDGYASLVIRDPIGEVFEEILDEIY